MSHAETSSVTLPFGPARFSGSQSCHEWLPAKHEHMPQTHSLISCTLQADFIVPSSREAVDCDNAWNELLREKVPNLFLQALQSFRQLPVSDADQPMAWVNRWLQSIPLPREVCPTKHLLLASYSYSMWRITFSLAGYSYSMLLVTFCWQASATACGMSAHDLIQQAALAMQIKGRQSVACLCLHILSGCTW